MESLIRELCAVVGHKACLHGDGVDWTPYATERRSLFVGRPLAVVEPATTAQVAEVVRLCAESRVAMVPQGGNTGLCGGAVPDDSGAQVVVALRRMQHVRALDAANDTMTVEAGCLLAKAKEAAAGAGRLLALDLASEGSCQIGGNMATNAGGNWVLRYGTMAAQVMGIEAVLPDGRLYNGLRAVRKDNTGYRLDDLFVGSEGTLGIITAGTLRLYPLPTTQCTACMVVRDLEAAVELLGFMRTALGDVVVAFEVMDAHATALVHRHMGTALPFAPGFAWLVLLEAWGHDAALEEGFAQVLYQTMERGLAQDVVLAESGSQRAALWALRENISEAERRQGPSIKHDPAVPRSVLPAFERAVRQAMEEVLPGSALCVFGHLGDGNLHINVFPPPGTETTQGLWAQVNRIVYDLAVEHGGSFSAEHGIGVLRRHELMRHKDPTALELMRQVKRMLDPHNLMNPGKVL
jgi:FAD/FMN-containing dehydrogenase